MSQIVRIRIHLTQMKDKELLMQAIEEAGYTCTQRKVGLFGFREEIRLHEKQISFRKSGDTYEMVSRNVGGAAQILREITQHYTQRHIYQVTRAKLEAQGFAVASEEQQKDGRIHLVLRRMA